MRSLDAVLLGSLLIGAIAAPATAGESTQFEIRSLTRLPSQSVAIVRGAMRGTFVHRPFACANFTPLTAPFDCPALVQFQIPDYPPGFLFGDFIPYKDLDAAHPQLQNELRSSQPVRFVLPDA
jgi:hypothetical protein